MAGADEGDSRLRVGPYVSHDESESVVIVPPPPVAQADARNEVTQLLPLVTAVGPVSRPAPPEPPEVEPVTGDTAVVRAVAKRAAAALPALGPATVRQGGFQARNTAGPVPVAGDPTDVVFAEIVPDDAELRWPGGAEVVGAEIVAAETVAAETVAAETVAAEAEVTRATAVLPPGGGVAPVGDVSVSMNVGPGPAVPEGGAVELTPPGRHADPDESGEEGVGDVVDHAAGSDQDVQSGPDLLPDSDPALPSSRAFAEA